ncbi:1,6-anhydro-N-acetylmuramyl-L-alanine amidase AmpD [Arenicella sp. 4NH20-0111]|uniref:1,6-anhydro-N-acetylmuramyl-L-alanine amidase AmpD n=1 Tax=Arenicella sp. 4NH20-0111 TaxID=3127648 RepID=UPI00310B8A02
MQLDKTSGLVDIAEWIASPNFDDRENVNSPEAVIIHCISLPPGVYGGNHIQRFFQNQLSSTEDPYFLSMAHLTVSSHFLITRSGHLQQFVSTNKRAWHAGESMLFNKPKVNDFSLGIELEGLDTDEMGFTCAQYSCLASLTKTLIEAYPSLNHNKIFAHSDIAPGRKPDPGPYFDWNRYLNLIDSMST